MSGTEIAAGATVKHSLTVQAENPARRRTLTLHDRQDKLDAFLQFNEREVLTHAGKLRADVAEKLTLERHESFDAARGFLRHDARRTMITITLEVHSLTRHSRESGNPVGY